MNTDIRLAVTFHSHPKIKKLRRRTGTKKCACCSLQRIWVYAAQERPKGVLTGMNAEDIAEIGEWTGDPDTFVRALVDLRLLDEQDGVFSIHGWSDRNSYASYSPERSDIARHAANSRWKKKHAQACSEHYTEQYEGMQPEQKGNAPSPAPIPYPSPSPEPSPFPAQNATSLSAKDVVTSDTPLPPLTQAAWDKLCEAYPKPGGIIEGRDAGLREFVKHPAEWGRWIQNAGHYAASKRAQDGYVMNLDKWLSGPFRDYDSAPVDMNAREELLAALRDASNHCLPSRLSDAANALFYSTSMHWHDLQKRVASGVNVFVAAQGKQPLGQVPPKIDGSALDEIRREREEVDRAPKIKPPRPVFMQQDLK